MNFFVGAYYDGTTHLARGLRNYFADNGTMANLSGYTFMRQYMWDRTFEGEAAAQQIEVQ